jgi:uncharacterized protein
MKFQADRADDVQIITGYGPGWLAINRQEQRGSHLVSSSGLLQPWDCPSFAALSAAHFAALAQVCADIERNTQRPVEVLLLGSGNQLRFVHPSWLRPLIQQRVGMETMDTPAALRTYNVLAMEGRNVLAALVLE